MQPVFAGVSGPVCSAGRAVIKPGRKGPAERPGGKVNQPYRLGPEDPCRRSCGTAVSLGNELGSRRTGAIGAVAAGALAQAARLGGVQPGSAGGWDGITVFFPAGLAGTEAFLLDRLARGGHQRLDLT
jgi:hypothetical protein